MIMQMKVKYISVTLLCCLDSMTLVEILYNFITPTLLLKYLKQFTIV